MMLDGKPEVVCGWMVGPVWKDDGETHVCCLPPDHVAEHECPCGATYSGCGHAIDEAHPRAQKPTDPEASA